MYMTWNVRTTPESSENCWNSNAQRSGFVHWQTNACMTNPLCSSMSKPFIWRRQSSENTWHVETSDMFKFAFFFQQKTKGFHNMSNNKIIQKKYHSKTWYSVYVSTNANKHKTNTTNKNKRQKTQNSTYINKEKLSTKKNPRPPRN